MQAGYYWLKEYIDFPYSPEELAEKLTMAGMEVDGVEYLGEGLEKIVIGEIKSFRKHPNADKLSLCEVDDGEEVRQIVCGAPNVKEGAKVPIARPGVTLPNGMEIKAARLRGEPSYGMICSTDELGLSKERAAGIMILKDEARVGSSFVDYYGLDEYVIKLDLTPNYAHCLGILGLAREIKAMQPGKELDIHYPAIALKESGEKVEDLIEVMIEDEDLCPRYTGRVIRNVKIGPSPDWLKERLVAAGIRPINNVVDITNFVMMEYNQPLHAFDYDRIIGKKIIVRRARDGEKLTTLDDQERQLNSEILVIADPEGAVGLAGVMGGANSEVTPETTNVFLESAYFDPINIRKTARKLGLPSEASHRFERGVDIAGLSEASNRAAYLMQEYAGGEVAPGIVDRYPEPFELKEIRLETSLVNKILGLELSAEEIAEMLERLEFVISASDGEGLLVKVPSYRNDVEREADLIEEVARIYGYNNIPVTRPESKQQGGKNRKQLLEDRTREIMVATGLDEVINLSLTGKGIYDQLEIPEDDDLRRWIRLKNPLNEAFALLRTSLLPGIVEVLSSNSRRQIEKMAIFELGNTFLAPENGEEPLESLKLAGGSMGAEEDHWQTGAADFFFLKGILEKYLANLGITELEFLTARAPYLHPGRSARIISAGRELGLIGEVLPGICRELDLNERAAIFEIDFKIVNELADLDLSFNGLPRYPAVERDMAILVDKDSRAGDILSEIKKLGGNLLKKALLFDLYQGDQIPEGEKSLAYKLLFQADDRTLRDEEVNELFTRITEGLGETFGAKIRGN